ncbi:MAG: hypothetical protein L0Y58_14075 [Verrucomicrobia subdivision 3 bacterium]|nr:hypothetical protein [Limisphaerales bacterium]
MRSDRAFVGDEEISSIQRQNAPISEIHSIDLSGTYGISDRWSVTLTLPFSYGERSAVTEHDFVHRHTMRASGLGDIRLVTDFWLRNPHEHADGNVAFGLGFKAPTGEDDATDTSHRPTGRVSRPVDPSIQPGDGGWGIILEMQGYQRICGNFYGYIGGYYMMTPEEQNDTEFTNADLFQGIPVWAKFNSIADQYSGRGGVSYLWPAPALTFSFGARIDGVPVSDAIGGSLGFRNPGYAVSVEPGVAWNYKKAVMAVSIPVAVYRNRERSAVEERANLPAFAASFADFLVLASLSFRF